MSTYWFINHKDKTARPIEQIALIRKGADTLAVIPVLSASQGVNEIYLKKNEWEICDLVRLGGTLRYWEAHTKPFTSSPEIVNAYLLEGSP